MMQIRATHGGVSVDGKMPLKFRSTGVAFSSEQTNKDCTAWSGGWTIGYIYYQAREEDRDEPLTWIW